MKSHLKWVSGATLGAVVVLLWPGPSVSADTSLGGYQAIAEASVVKAQAYLEFAVSQTRRAAALWSAKAIAREEYEGITRDRDARVADNCRRIPSHSSSKQRSQPGVQAVTGVTDRARSLMRRNDRH